MFAKKIITETDHAGKVKNIPLLPNKQFEIIVLDLNETKAMTKRILPRPDSSICGSFGIRLKPSKKYATGSWTPLT